MMWNRLHLLDLRNLFFLKNCFQWLIVSVSTGSSADWSINEWRMFPSKQMAFITITIHARTQMTLQVSIFENTPNVDTCFTISDATAFTGAIKKLIHFTWAYNAENILPKLSLFSATLEHRFSCLCIYVFYI